MTLKPILSALVLLAAGSLATVVSAAQPKRVLVVSATAAFRHSAIPQMEKLVRQLAQESNGEFTVVTLSDELGYPWYSPMPGTPPPVNPLRGPTPKQMELLRTVLAKHMSVEGLKQYDAVLFASTTGSLPIPDVDAFLDWIAAGHAFIGLHSATDTFHDSPRFLEMIGGEFDYHGKQAAGTLVNLDPAHPATQGWGPSRVMFEELYMFKTYDRTKVHSLISMTTRPDDGRGPAGDPGWFPVAWTKLFGQGRVFYTSLGHREDIVLPNYEGGVPNGNPPEIADAYRLHVLGGIRWALGLAPGEPKAP